MKYEFLGKTISGPFTIPSGIVATAAPIIQRLFDSVPQVGVMTTKSIGPVPRSGNREPIMTQYAPGCFMNAVGLTNPGAEVAAKQLAALDVPDDRFLLTSIFGGSIEEIVAVAKLLAPHSDGLELNLSCPHASGYGMDMGQDADLVREITAAVKAAVDIPVIPKLTPNVPNIGEIASAAVEGGADGLCAINTVGPAYYTSHGQPVLTNKVGGMSGRGVLPIALKCIKEIREAVDVPLIGCGGITTVEDVRAFRHEGASVYGIGSTLTGLNSDEIVSFFAEMQQAFERGTALPVHTGAVDMSFRPYTLVDIEQVCEDIAILRFDRKLDIQAGEFIYAWVPGLGEKPFSALTDDPFSLVVIDVGVFTHELLRLEAGTTVYVRGPHGVKVSPPDGSKIVAVAGGTGLAAVYQIARDFGDAEIFVGARTSERLYFKDKCAAIASTHIATDDGSEGFNGVVTSLLEEWLETLPAKELKKLVFYNCGPGPMVHAAVEVQQKFAENDRIFSAIDYLTKCGVGICGACHAPDGRRLCVDGPFLTANAN
ncbi:MAG: dihydroorotate dehydrogenase [Gammaproteobacteria bacterium]|nr:dihydroorotate dehydrogenase [Gammaproteobacteria bacterium]